MILFSYELQPRLHVRHLAETRAQVPISLRVTGFHPDAQNVLSSAIQQNKWLLCREQKHHHSGRTVRDRNLLELVSSQHLLQTETTRRRFSAERFTPRSELEEEDDSPSPAWYQELTWNDLLHHV